MMRRWRSPESLLLPIGEVLAKFVCEEDFANVKACEGHTCTLVFADRTRRRARRWCSMAICGNRAKQAAHRGRLKALTASGCLTQLPGASLLGPTSLAPLPPQPT